MVAAHPPLQSSGFNLHVLSPLALAGECAQSLLACLNCLQFSPLHIQPPCNAVMGSAYRPLTLDLPSPLPTCQYASSLHQMLR